MGRAEQEGLRCSGIGAAAHSARLVRRRLSANWTWRGPHRSRATRVAPFTRMSTFEQSACHCDARRTYGTSAARSSRLDALYRTKEWRTQAQSASMAERIL